MRNDDAELLVMSRIDAYWSTESVYQYASMLDITNNSVMTGITGSLVQCISCFIPNSHKTCQYIKMHTKFMEAFDIFLLETN